MKKTVLVGVAALAAVSAMGQGRSPSEKIPKRYRRSVLREIQAESYRQSMNEMEKKFGIVQEPTGWTNNCGKSAWINVRTSGGSMLCAYDRNGRLVRVGNREDSEEWRWREARQKEIQEALWKDQAVVDAAVSNVVARVQQRQSRNQGRPRLGSLEELVPIEEAMMLAKDGDGKGYFQLALRYANGQELPCNPQRAYKMLSKAVALNYANAILVEGLLDEENLKATLGMDGLVAEAGGLFARMALLEQKARLMMMRIWEDDSASIRRKALREYCGKDAPFDTGKHRRNTDSLTNKVAVARVMGKYEKAKALGAWVATNQIAALNKRLSNFNHALATKREADEKKRKEKNAADEKEKAESAKRLANNRTVHAVVGAEELTRYRVAFKEMFGYEMGETIMQEASDKTETGHRWDGTNNRWKEWRRRRLRTPYRDFTLMRLRCVADRLCEVEIELTPGNNGTSDSLDQEALAIVRDLAQRYGIEHGKWDYQRRWSEEEDWCAEEYGWKFMVMVNRGTITVQVFDDDLEWELQDAAKKRREESREINPSKSVKKNEMRRKNGTKSL